MRRAEISEQIRRAVVERRAQAIVEAGAVQPRLLVLHPETFEGLALDPPSAVTDELPLPDPGLPWRYRGIEVLCDPHAPRDTIEVRW